MNLYAGSADGHLLAWSDTLKPIAEVKISERAVSALLLDAGELMACTHDGLVQRFSRTLEPGVARRLGDTALVALAHVAKDGANAIAVGAASAAVIVLQARTLVDAGYIDLAPNTLSGLASLPSGLVAAAMWEGYLRGVSANKIEPKIYSPSEKIEALIATSRGALLAPTASGRLVIWRADQPDIFPREITLATGAVACVTSDPLGDALAISKEGTLWRFDTTTDVRVALGPTLLDPLVMCAAGNRVFVGNARGEIAVYAQVGEGIERLHVVNLKKPMAVLLADSA